jgi:hypothetical protein
LNACSAVADRLTPFKKFLQNPKIGNGSSFSNLSYQFGPLRIETLAQPLPVFNLSLPDQPIIYAYLTARKTSCSPPK